MHLIKEVYLFITKGEYSHKTARNVNDQISDSQSDPYETLRVDFELQGVHVGKKKQFGLSTTCKWGSISSGPLQFTPLK